MDNKISKEQENLIKSRVLKNMIISEWLKGRRKKEELEDIVKKYGININIYEDKEYGFRETFDTQTGQWITGDDKNGKDPFRRSFPSLLDVGIMGNCPNGREGICAKAGIQCYQNAPISCKPNMKLEDFKTIVDQCKGQTFQFALGGAGDPNLHENFKEIVDYCVENNIVPNYTTSGFNLTDEQVEISKKCGAVAVSQYSRLNTNISSINTPIYEETNPQTNIAIQKFIDAGIKTNIHYVLGNNTIEEAIIRLEEGLFPKGINAIIFLMHKPVGLGTEDNVLKYDNPLVEKFFWLIDNNQYPFQIGFDACSIPAIVNFCNNIDSRSTETCEGARTSGYIDAQMNMMPCSFGNDNPNMHVNLYDNTIKEAWESEVFNKFRNHLSNSCSECKDRAQCMGGCPIVNDIVLCNRQCRRIEK